MVSMTRTASYRFGQFALDQALGHQSAKPLANRGRGHLHRRRQLRHAKRSRLAKYVHQAGIGLFGNRMHIQLNVQPQV
jgi:hypothetical protein